MIDKIFNPKNIAVIGASRDPRSVGQGILKSLTQGCVFKTRFCMPFHGKIFPINPKADTILGVKCYQSILKVPENVDLAVICVPARVVPQIMKDCVSKGVKAAIIISAGFAEIKGIGKDLQDEVVKIAKKGGISIVGPNCLGVIRTKNNMNASFAPSMPPKGNIAFISQSGAVADSIIDWSIEHNYGFSTIISYGNRADLDVHNFLDYLADDPETKAIAIYMEGLDDGKKFMESAKRLSKKKPIVILKGGKTEKGAKAISSHTGSLAGSYEIYKAVFRQCGIHIAENIEELFDIAKTLAFQPPCKNNIAIITNAGGAGVLCADACDDHKVNIIDFKESTLKRLDNTKKMHPAYSRHNPLDLVGDALPERYKAALDILLKEKYISGAIVIQTLQTMTDPIEDAKIVIRANKRFKNKPIVCAYLGGKFTKKSIELLETNNIPQFNDPSKAANAIKALVERYEFLKK